MVRPRFSQRVTVTLVVVGVLVVLALVVGVGSTSAACATCHGDVVAATGDSVHASTGCYSCHAPGLVDKVGFKAAELLRMYPARLVGREITGAVSETPRAGCVSCHGDVLDKVAPGNSGIRIDHTECAPEASCDSCHSTTAHGKTVRWIREPVMERCTACHRQEQASIACDTCHNGRLQRERLAVGPWQVTHGRNWKTVHGMGDLDSCATCHPTDYCTRCHKVSVPHGETFGSEHGAVAIADRKSCTTCHKNAKYCDSCHGVEMPHPKGFLKQHSKIAKGVMDPACERCHAPEDCQRCHNRHIHPGYAREASGLDPKVPGAGGGSK